MSEQPMADRRIGVVTVTYHSGEVLQPFLDCCAQQSGVPWKLFVVDNASRDSTRAILAREPRPWMEVILNDGNLGVAEGNNQGIKAALAQGLTVRGAISIARRFQDPLAELVKVEPKSIGVGQYQHDVNQTALKKGLDDAVESCVNRVGVDLNTASYRLLSYVAGMAKA